MCPAREWGHSGGSAGQCSAVRAVCRVWGTEALGGGRASHVRRRARWASMVARRARARLRMEAKVRRFSIGLRVGARGGQAWWRAAPVPGCDASSAQPLTPARLARGRCRARCWACVGVTGPLACWLGAPCASAPHAPHVRSRLYRVEHALPSRACLPAVEEADPPPHTPATPHHAACPAGPSCAP